MLFRSQLPSSMDFGSQKNTARPTTCSAVPVSCSTTNPSAAVRLWLLAVFLLSISLTINGQEADSGHRIRISLLTCSPGGEEAYTLYGHTAIRIQGTSEEKGPTRMLDYVFNYGIFDFSKPNFIYRFARGETDYILGVMDFETYLHEYRMRGSEVCEQELNLDSTEQTALLQALTVNALPENRVYRYKQRDRKSVV